nr:TAT (twin-arginine translocation) pathway signal sequence [Schwartzia sp. (in: firmicutes)]
LSMPAAARAVALLRRLAAEQYGMNESDLDGARFNAFRNYVGAHLSFMKIDELNAAEGFEAVREAVAELVHS